jgi:hypothetical protein
VRGNVRLQRAVIYEFDVAEETRPLLPGELELRRELEANVLGLSSLARSMPRQRARTRGLQEGDACTKYFHLRACHRRRKNYLFTVSYDGQTFSEQDAKADIVFSYYNGLLGSAFTRQHRIDLSQLDIPQLGLSELVARIVRESPADRAPGPDGFNRAFFVRVFHVLWELDIRSFHSLNGAVMVLLHKTEAPTGLRDYSPTSLIHSIRKLFAKGLTLRLAPRMPHIVRDNQSTFIQRRQIHENFRTILLACRWLNAR